MCSSRNRPERLKDTILSFNATKNIDTELVVYVAENDSRINDYKKMLEEMNQKHIIGCYRTMIEVLNYLSCELFPDLKYYGDVNDDHIYRTKNWDIELMKAIDSKNGWSIAYGLTQNLPSPLMMSGKLIRTLGYYLPPNFQHSHVDNFIMDIGKMFNLLTYVPEVNIEHMHIIFGKANMDDNYKWVTSQDVYIRGVADLQYWITNCRDNDILKIKTAMEKENHA
jgi:hypothetical protein